MTAPVGGGSLPLLLLVGVIGKNNGSFASNILLPVSEPLFLHFAHRSLAPPIADTCVDRAYREMRYPNYFGRASCATGDPTTRCRCPSL